MEFLCLASVEHPVLPFEFLRAHVALQLVALVEPNLFLLLILYQGAIFGANWSVAEANVFGSLLYPLPTVVPVCRDDGFGC